jgi:lactate dehydrogenase-like 2-hydroxyacid dehydrogenase
MKKIAVTKPEYEKANDIFESSENFECIPAPEHEDELVKSIQEKGADHAIIGIEAYRGPLYNALPEGGVLARFGVGHDSVDKQKATLKGLYCTNTPGALTDSVAEYAISLLLAVAKRLVSLASNCKDGEWTLEIGAELNGKTLAIIGCGAIGCRMAQIASYGLNMKVIGCDIASLPVEAYKQTYGFSEIYNNFPQSVSEADYVSLNLSSTPETAHYINSERLAMMSQKSCLINTARGAVVSEDELFDALSNGTISGAALDVFENEPYKPASESKDLRTLDNVIMTPHRASSTHEACAQMAKQCLQNIIFAQNGEYEKMNLLNPEVLRRD